MIYPRIFLYGLFAVFLMFFPIFFASAFNLIGPSGSGIKTDVYFQWQYNVLSGLDHYQLEIHAAGPAAWVPLNITKAGHCGDSICSVGALEFVNTFPLQKGEYQYEWKVIAKNAEDVTLGVSSKTGNFKTEGNGPSCPPDCPPPDCPPQGCLGTPGFDPTKLNPIASTTLLGLLSTVLNVMFAVAIVVLPIVIVYGGILLLGSQGEPAKVSQGKQILMWAVIGFIVILLARGVPLALRFL